MRKKIKTLTHAQKAKRLRAYGFTVALGTKRRGKVIASNAAKAAVTKKWKTIKNFVEGRQTFVFQKLSPSESKELRKGLNKFQFTPGGVFHRKPKGSKKTPRYTVNKDGVIEYQASGPKGGRVIEEIHPIDPKLLAEDPPRAIMALQKRAKKNKIVLTVNGHNSVQTVSYDLDALAFYIATQLLPKFLDPNLDEAYTNAHNKARKKRTIKDFVDTFHIKIIRHIRPKTKNEKSKRKRAR